MSQLNELDSTGTEEAVLDSKPKKQGVHELGAANETPGGHELGAGSFRRNSIPQAQVQPIAGCSKWSDSQAIRKHHSRAAHYTLIDCKQTEIDSQFAECLKVLTTMIEPVIDCQQVDSQLTEIMSNAYIVIDSQKTELASFPTDNSPHETKRRRIDCAEQIMEKELETRETNEGTNHGAIVEKRKKKCSTKACLPFSPIEKKKRCKYCTYG